jgi:hypothetical protein
MDCMVEDWAQRLRPTARRKTWLSNLLRTARTLSLIGVPAAIQASTRPSWNFNAHPYLAMTTAFAAYAVLLVAYTCLLVTVIRPGAPFATSLVDPFNRLATWFLIALYGYFLWDIDPILFNAGWGLSAAPILLQRYFEKKRQFRGARLIDGNYKLVGFISEKRPWRRTIGKLASAKLYVLPADSPLGQHSVQILPLTPPEIYVGAKARELIGSDSFRAVLAHEFGHSLGTTTVGVEALSWGLRLFGLPVLMTAALTLLNGRLLWVPGHTGLSWLSIAVLVWLLWHWLLLLLHRPVEYAADRYAVEVTRSHAALIEGFKRMAEVHAYNVFPNFVDALGMNSHPCLLWRIRRLEKLRNAFDQEAAKKATSRPGRRR